jgi:hypothetical protein
VLKLEIFQLEKEKEILQNASSLTKRKISREVGSKVHSMIALHNCI